MFKRFALVPVLGTLGVVALATLTACDGPIDDLIAALNKRPPPPAPPPPYPRDAGLPVDAGPAPRPVRCVDDLPPPPPPGTGQCPAEGTACPGRLPEVLPCIVYGREAFMICDSGPTGKTWRLDVIECRPLPPRCENDLPPPPAGVNCPAAGSTCTGSLPYMPCNNNGSDAFMACDGPLGQLTWRFDVIECPPPPR